MLVASLGTQHEIQTAGTILFLEDVAAKPYQIDRMLMQLKLAGKLKDVRGIIFGEMLDCRQSPDQDYTLEEVVLRVVGDLRIPVAFGLRSGHVSRANITLPIGVKARLEVGAEVRLRILEAATSTNEQSLMSSPKHIHLVGICGTAMASLAGMLQERGFRVTGSDAAAYPPMSTFLESLGIPVAQPFAEANLNPRPDLVVVGNALSRGNVELECLLDERIPFCSLPQTSARRVSGRKRSSGGCRNARQNDNDLDAGVDL